MGNKNNIKTVLAYGNIKAQIKESDKMYTTVFDKEKDKVIFFECYLERPVGYSGNIDVTWIISSGNASLPAYTRTFQVSPEINMFTVGITVVNRVGEHMVNGDYTAKFKIGESDDYYFDFTITGKAPLRFGILKIIFKSLGL